MATTKTIKPGGGGDYTTLASWWTFAQGESTAQHAECYTGGDLGEVNIASATFTPTDSEYFRIYAADGEKHDGTTASTGAYININSTSHGVQISEHYTRIEGIRFTANALKDGVFVNGADGCVIDSCNFVAEGSTGFRNGINCEVVEANGGIYIRNNVIYGLGKGGGGGIADYGAITVVVMIFSGTYDWASYIENNSIHNVHRTTDGYGRGITCIEVQIGGTLTHDVEARNNIATDCETVDYYESITNGTITGGGYNTSSDGTGNIYGSTGSETNEAAADIYTTPASDLRLLTTAEAYDGGTTSVNFTNSNQGVTRPEGAAWDKGAFEMVQTYAPANMIVI